MPEGCDDYRPDVDRRNSEPVCADCLGDLECLAENVFYCPECEGVRYDDDVIFAPVRPR